MNQTEIPTVENFKFEYADPITGEVKLYTDAEYLTALKEAALAFKEGTLVEINHEALAYIYGKFEDLNAFIDSFNDDLLEEAV